MNEEYLKNKLAKRGDLVLELNRRLNEKDARIKELEEERKEAGELELDNSQLYVRETSNLTLEILSLNKRIKELEGRIKNYQYKVSEQHNRINELKALLDEADQEDFFGTEGWRHLLYEEPMPKEDYLYDLAKEKRLREKSS
jgi:peptidoglycan hydrolase CwlO-like protein